MEQKYKLNICIVFKGNIFKTTAPVNRILSLAEGLKISGAETFIYGFVPLSDNENSKLGNLNNIIYSYPGIISSNFSIRAFISLIDLFYRFPKFILKNKINLVHIYGIPLFAKWIIIMQKFIFSYKIIEERNEYPHILLKNNKLKFIYGQFHIIIAYRFLDGMIVMTNKLLQYYTPLTSKKTKFEIINMTVDNNRFEVEHNKIFSPSYNYIAYCGGLTEDKDGVLTLIKAFHAVSNAMPDLKLLIIGKGGEVQNNAINSLIHTLMLKEKIILTGFLLNEVLTLYLLNAKALVLPRPKSFQNEGNFPTKLGEYLSTGNPVIVTRVGVVPEFLFDGKNAYIAEPNSAESLAAKIIELVSDYEKARTIGIKGKLLTTFEFNHIVQSKKLYDFLYNLCFYSEN